MVVTDIGIVIDLIIVIGGGEVIIAAVATGDGDVERRAQLLLLKNKINY